MKKALVLGAGGFIGSHLVKRLKSEGYWVRGVDLRHPEFSKTEADEFITRDLTDIDSMRKVIRFKGYSGNFYVDMIDRFAEPFDEIYQLAADMGGAEYVFTGENDANIMQNSASINLNLLRSQKEFNDIKESNTTKIFYSSSACIYPEHNQIDPGNVNCVEESAYPANPDSEYGWEKLFSERMYLAYSKNYNMPVVIARYHNVYGPESTYKGGREKSPAALCRKVAEQDSEIDVFGSGKQTRSFLYVDDCLDATRMLMEAGMPGPYNVGSEDMISIDNLAQIIIHASGKKISINHVSGPIGVNARTSDNFKIFNHIGWRPKTNMIDGLTRTYNWIKNQIEKDRISTS